MRYEAKTERDAVEAAAKALNRTPESIKYRVIRDEKSFWGGRVVEIEIEGEPEIAAPDLLRGRLPLRTAPDNRDLDGHRSGKHDPWSDGRHVAER